MKSNQETENNRLAALAGTIVFHGLLFLIFVLIVFKTPIPPFPETGGNGIEVNFGDSEDGMGAVQPEELASSSTTASTAEEVADPPIEISTPVRPSAKPILTQEIEEAPTEVKVEPTENASNTTATEIPVEPPKKVNTKGLYPGKRSDGGNTAKGEGETNKAGDQGVKEGSRTSTYHGPGGGNGNTPGNGTDGPGGEGKGGPRYSLTNRKANSLPIPRAAFQEEGKVVVEITVDKNGNVIKAKPGVKGSTTSNPNLLDIARRAAMSAKFNPANDAPEEQKGTITYNFILK
jgi:TonB family protein